MAKTKRVKKHYPTDIPLAENVRLLKCGAWGYIYDSKAVFKSKDVEMVNEFSRHVKEQNLKYKIGISGAFLVSPIEVWAAEWQKLEGEPKILPNCHLCDNKTWRVEGNHYEAVVRQKY